MGEGISQRSMVTPGWPSVRIRNLPKLLKKALLPGSLSPRGIAFGLFCDTVAVGVLMVAVAAFAFGCIDDGFDDTVGHADPDDVQGIPQAAMKDHVAGVPNPFKTEGKHNYSSLTG